MRAPKNAAGCSPNDSSTSLKAIRVTVGGPVDLLRLRLPAALLSQRRSHCILTRSTPAGGVEP